jgi:hypothetical protein
MTLRSVLLSLGQGIAATIAGIIIYENPDETLGNFTVVGYIGIATSLISFLILRKIKDQY